jgi:hypothetical protein
MRRNAKSSPLSPLEVESLIKSLSRKLGRDLCGTPPTQRDLLNRDIQRVAQQGQAVVPAVLSALEEARRQGQVEWRIRLLDVLSKMPGQPALGELFRAIEDKDPYVRHSVTWLLASMSAAPPEAVERVLARLKDSDDDVRQRAIGAVGRLALRQSREQKHAMFEALRFAWTDESPEIRFAVVQAAAAFAPEETELQALLAVASKDSFPHIAEEAATMLAQWDKRRTR